MSGTIPDSVRGISWPRRRAPMVPFCPWRLELPVQQATSSPFRRTKKICEGTERQYT